MLGTSLNIELYKPRDIKAVYFEVLLPNYLTRYATEDCESIYIAHLLFILDTAKVSEEEYLVSMGLLPHFNYTSDF